MSITSESKSQSLTVNGISADREICSRLVPQAQKFHLKLSLLHLLQCWWRGESPARRKEKKTSTDHLIQAAGTLPDMTTSAEKRPRPRKVHKEPKREMSSIFSQCLIKMKGKGLLLENTAHYREFLLCSPEEFTSFRHWLLATSGLKSLCATESFSPPTSTND